MPQPGVEVDHPIQTPPSLLLLILDLHPLSWSLLAQTPSENLPPANGVFSKAPETSIQLSDFITILLVFLNAHLASRWGNEVVVYGATAGRSKQLYPPPPSGAGPSKRRANMYAPFHMLNASFDDALRAMIDEEEERMTDKSGKGLNESPALVSALTKALCYINRVAPTPAASALTQTQPGTSNAETVNPERLETRILLINATPGSSSLDNLETEGPKPPVKQSGGNRGGYVGMMNCVFAAQKAKVPIDVLTLPPLSGNTAPPIFLQQAAHLTEGIYWRWNGHGGLLQYLHTIYLPPPSLRHTSFAVPPQDAVDFRAVCFCHHDVVDIGFVCSVCLSIFCKPLPVCKMCSTKFPIKSLPHLKALAAGIEAIPIPDTVPPPVVPKIRIRQDGVESKKRKGSGVVRGSDGAPIEVD